MYPNLRYALYDWFGVDIPALGVVQTYGLFLAITFLVSGVVLMREIKRREREGLLKGVIEKRIVGAPASMQDLVINFLLGFIFGWKIGYWMLNGNEVAASGMDFLISWKGNILTGLLAGAGLAYWKFSEKKKAQLDEPVEKEVLVMPHNRVADILILASVSAIVGAKLLFFVEYPEKFSFQEIFSPGGLTIYGGLLFGFITVSLYFRWKKINYMQMLDTSAPVLILAYGIGRQGCHWSGDGDWGVVNNAAKPFSWLPDWLWAFRYPNNVNSDGVSMLPDCNGFAELSMDSYCNILPEPVWPTSMYETFMCLAIFGILWFMRKRVQMIPGLIFSTYLILNGLERYLIEGIRVNDRYDFLFLRNTTVSELIALGILTSGVIMTSILLWKWKKRQSAPEAG